MTQSFINNLSDKLQKVGTLHAIGETWISIDSTIPAGGIPYLGQLVNRSTWADLFAWASANGKVKTEAEWQEFATYHGGNCPFYSDGDGSTTFRMPRIRSYLKGAETLDKAGGYAAEGLPNITGNVKIGSTNYEADNTTFGAFQYEGNNKFGVGGGGAVSLVNVSFAASRSSAIYGNSDHVTPETHSILIGVYAVGIATNIGSADATQFLNGLATVEANLEAHNRVIETWSDGTNWYRKWKDGFIEQGGRILSATAGPFFVTLNTPFTNTNYFVSVTPNSSSNGTTVYHHVGKAETTSSFSYYNGGTSPSWYACGY